MSAHKDWCSCEDCVRDTPDDRHIGCRAESRVLQERLRVVEERTQQRLDELIATRGELVFLRDQFQKLSLWAKTLRGLDHYAAVLAERAGGPSPWQKRNEWLAKAGWEHTRAAKERLKKLEHAARRVAPLLDHSLSCSYTKRATAYSKGYAPDAKEDACDCGVTALLVLLSPAEKEQSDVK